MRRLVKIAAAASVLGTAFFGTAEAAFIGMPMNLGVQLEHPVRNADSGPDGPYALFHGISG